METNEVIEKQLEELFDRREDVLFEMLDLENELEELHDKHDELTEQVAEKVQSICQLQLEICSLYKAEDTLE